VREVEYTTSFRKDYKRLAKSGRHNMSELQEVVTILAHDLPLVAKHHDHALSGDWDGYRECHVKPGLAFNLQGGSGRSDSGA